MGRTESLEWIQINYCLFPYSCSVWERRIRRRMLITWASLGLHENEGRVSRMKERWLRWLCVAPRVQELLPPARLVSSFAIDQKLRLKPWWLVLRRSNENQGRRTGSIKSWYRELFKNERRENETWNWKEWKQAGVALMAAATASDEMLVLVTRERENTSLLLLCPLPLPLSRRCVFSSHSLPLSLASSFLRSFLLSPQPAIPSLCMRAKFQFFDKCIMRWCAVVILQRLPFFPIFHPSLAVNQKDNRRPNLPHG